MLLKLAVAASRRGWTRKAVLEALQAWAREEGRAPRAYEWAPWAAAILGVSSPQTRKAALQAGRKHQAKNLRDKKIAEKEASDHHDH